MLGEDRHGLWVWGPAGTVISRPGASDRIQPARFVKVIPDDQWWTALWPETGDHRVFVDIIAPVEWDGSRAVMVDLDLDVVQWADGTVEIEDEDEFLQHQVSLEYPEWLIDGARAATARLAIAVEAGAEPFGRAAARWLEVAGTVR